MNNKSIKFDVKLDEDNVPESILWNATDSGSDKPLEAKAISLSMWDPKEDNTLRIDLWTKEMQIHEMKRFYIDCIGGMSQSLLSATGDDYMANEMKGLCDKLVTHLENEMKNLSQDSNK